MCRSPGRAVREEAATDGLDREGFPRGVGRDHADEARPPSEEGDRPARLPGASLFRSEADQLRDLERELHREPRRVNGPDDDILHQGRETAALL